MATLEKPTGKLLYVGGLDDTVNEEILHGAFLPFGPVRSLEIPIELTTRKHKGFGFVEFEQKDDAKQAIDNMNEAELCGRVLKVKLAKPNKLTENAARPIWSEDSWHQLNTQHIAKQVEESKASMEGSNVFNGQEVKSQE
mmetsp:Transcript_54367/g.62291  ORF Transcript_54367/g.62291 Transcript_54367/m.62291 type:complete len:140 (-) Transcript_54367:524-943(-)